MAFVHASVGANGRHGRYEAWLRRELYILDFIPPDATLLVLLRYAGKICEN